MAELLGLVASGAGLASLSAQILDGAIRLKDLYRSYREAPKRLQDLSEELEVLARYLQVLDKDRAQQSDHDYAILDRCVGICSRASSVLFAAIKKFETAIDESNIKGRFLIALAQKDIAQLCNDLERAKSSLLLACNLYTAECSKTKTALLFENQNRSTALILESQHRNTALILATQQAHSLVLEDLGRRTTTIQQRQMCELTKPLTDEERSSSSTIEQPKQTKRRSNFNIVQRTQDRPGETRWGLGSRRTRRFRLSPWFTTRVWEISFNFDITIRPSNFVPHDALILEVCRGGDILEVRALFETGQASPFDCSYRPGHWPSGETVLAAAAASGNLQLCRYLVETAGFPVYPPASEEPLNAYVKYGLWYSETYAEQANEMYRLLTEQPGWDVDGLLGGTKRNYPWWLGCPNYSCVRLIRDKFSATFSTLSWEAQVELAIDSCGLRADTMPYMFLEMLGHSRVNRRIAQAHDRHGRTALHAVAKEMRWVNYVPSTWIDFVRQLLLHDADIHRVTKSGYTPFTCLLASTRPGRSKSSVKAWLTLFREVGIDLMEYGSAEKMIWNTWEHPYIRNESFTIQEWTYGPGVDDWTVDSVFRRRIPIYVLESAPGAWPANDRYNIRTICWRPTGEDDSEGTDRWSHVRDVTLESSGSSDMLQRYRNDHGHEFGDAQDDCDAVMRLVQNSSRARTRPRSCSQPTKFYSPVFKTHRSWLPLVHYCLEDGLAKFSNGNYWQPAERRCAKGSHPGGPEDGRDYHENIKRQIRRFQTRYRDEGELRALPYAAYHPTWKRNKTSDIEER